MKFNLTRYSKSAISFTLFFLLYFNFCALGQSGLENVIVEKYYISNGADSAGSRGNLPVGSVTYRVFLDMRPGYKFQAIYGINSPFHELRFATTTSFFNNEEAGNTSPAFAKTVLPQNTIMLDSWLSVGGASNGNYGVLKSEDDSKSTVVNADGILLNKDKAAGIPLTVQDGLLAGIPPEVMFAGIPARLLQVFNTTSGTGNLFSTTNGSVASLSGSMGPTASNCILIGQFTTDGIFSFELNVQIMAPDLSIENYVARNPSGKEMQKDFLIYPH